MSIATLRSRNPYPRIIRCPSDSASKTDNTLASDDTLFWSVGANEVWWFEAYLIYTAANATMDLKIGWQVPAGTTMSWGTIGNANLGGWASPGTGTSSIAILTASDPLPYGTATLTQGAACAGIVASSSTAGTVFLQWAQNTTDAGSLVRKANSIMKVGRVG